MPSFTEEPDRIGLTAALGRMADGFSKLVLCHLALAKLELAAEVKVVAGSLGRVAAGIGWVPRYDAGNPLDGVRATTEG